MIPERQPANNRLYRALRREPFGRGESMDRAVFVLSAMSFRIG
jgi:hypothetical protein